MLQKKNKISKTSLSVHFKVQENQGQVKSKIAMTKE